MTGLDNQGRGFPAVGRGFRGGPRVNLIDGFEDGDLAEYGGDVSYFNVQQTTVSEGSYALEAPATTNTRAVSQTDITVSTPYTLLIDYRVESGVYAGPLWATQSETGAKNNSGYMIEPYDENGKFRLFRLDSGSETKLASEASGFPLSTFGLLEINHKDDGSMTVTGYDGTGTQVNQLSVVDSNYLSGGTGGRSTSGGVQYMDYYREEG